VKKRKATRGVLAFENKNSQREWYMKAKAKAMTAEEKEEREGIGRDVNIERAEEKEEREGISRDVNIEI